jgi:hypothetical protein
MGVSLTLRVSYGVSGKANLGPLHQWMNAVQKVLPLFTQVLAEEAKGGVRRSRR